jgi:ribosomal protein S18 acetylase RimI-like enzyme
MFAPSTRIAVRPAQIADLELLLDLWLQLQAHHGRLQPRFFRVGTRAQAALDLRALISQPGRALLVAQREEALLGLVQLGIYDTPAQLALVQRRRAYVEDMVVDQACRRQGVGRLLMAAASQWAIEQGAVQLLLTVWAGNSEAEQFYRALGYQPINQVLGRELRAE